MAECGQQQADERLMPLSRITFPDADSMMRMLEQSERVHASSFDSMICERLSGKAFTEMELIEALVAIVDEYARRTSKRVPWGVTARTIPSIIEAVVPMASQRPVLAIWERILKKAGLW